MEVHYENVLCMGMHILMGLECICLPAVLVRGQLWMLPFRCYPLFVWEKVFHWPKVSPSRLRWQPVTQVCFSPCHCWHKSVCHHSWLFCGVWGLNLTLGVCKASILPTEPVLVYLINKINYLIYAPLNSSSWRKG